jgi:hypothetical protein
LTQIEMLLKFKIKAMIGYKINISTSIDVRFFYDLQTCSYALPSSIPKMLPVL